MEGLDFNSIYGGEEIENLFMEPEDNPSEVAEEKVNKEEETPGEPSENSETNKTTEDVDPEDLFGEEEKQPESVGSEKNNQEDKEGSPTDTGGGTSPNNFYSSITNAMAEDGIFPNSSEEEISKVDSAEKLYELIESEVKARFDETQQRVAKALENGVEPNDIRMYEGTIQQLNGIKDSDVSAETEDGEALRYKLIVQDYLNKGISRDKADKMAKRSIDAGTDIEDAKDALQSNKEYFQNAYNKLLKDAEAEAEAEKAERKKQAEKLKDSIMKDKQPLGEIELGNDIRQKAYDSIAKPVYKDPETGAFMTAIQKYEQEHPTEFLKYSGLFFALTKGYTDFKSLFKGEVKKEMKKGLRDLEQTLRGSKTNSDGSFKFVTTAKEDPESFMKFKLDI